MSNSDMARQQFALAATTRRDHDDTMLVIPTCMFCMRIRGTDGSWIPVARDLLTIKGIALSHSLCPACEQVHHPDLVPPTYIVAPSASA